MKTSPRLVAALAAATLLLTACGSDDAADTSSSAPAAATSSDAMEPSSADSSAAQTSTEDTSTSEESTSEDSTSEESGSDESTAGSTEATRIIGGDVDTLDETSAAWFSAMCTGIAPLMTASDTLSATGSDPAAAAAAVEEMGAGLVTTSGSLAELPAPTFDGGDDLAATVIAGLQLTGEKFQEASAQIAANDPAALTTINEALESNPLGELQGSKMNPELQDDFRALPACAPLNN